MPVEIWNESQIKTLEARQSNTCLHPYTCACHSKNLVPTKNGWTCSVTGKIRQTWAHEEDLNESNN